MLLVPSLVNLAFSAELFFKFIIDVEQAEKAHGHSLKKLLTKSNKQKDLIDCMKIDPAVFMTNLDGINNAFVDWRYAYEADNLEINMEFFINFVKCLRRIANSL